jgi:uncharacterized protein YtpQ (UPF0354 family)
VRAGLIALGLLAVLAACSGDGDEPSSQVLPQAVFAQEAAEAIIAGTELQAEPGSEPAVSVSAEDSFDSFTLQLGKAYQAYRQDPARLDRFLDTIVEQAETTMDQGNSRRPFSAVRNELLPLLKPVPAFRGLREEPATTPFPGNVRVLYVVQEEDSLTAVTSADLERWGRSRGEIHAVAIANLLRETNRDDPLLCEEALCGWASGDGYDAARMIVPELRRQIAREIGTAVYAVPTETVYVALPIRFADRIRPRVEQQFVTAESPVSQDLFVERGGRLVVLRR